MNIIPDIGSKGILSLRAPFTVNNSKQYECVAIRFLSDIINNDEDPYELYYATIGIDRATYQADVITNVAIISFKSEDGTSWLYVPSSYVMSYPNPNVVKYLPIAICAHIGIVKENTVFSNLLSEFTESAKVLLGIVPVIRVVAVGDTVLLREEQSVALESHRNNTMETTLPNGYSIATLLQTVTELQNTNALLVSENAALKDFISSL